MGIESYQQQIEVQTLEKQRVSEVLRTLRVTDKINIVIQSFIVGAGTIEAHNLYVAFLCQAFRLTPREGGLLLRQCFDSLSDEEKRPVVQAAYQTHLDRMKNTVSSTKKLHQRTSSQLLGNFEAAVISIENNLPSILENAAFNDISPHEQALLAQLPKDFSVRADSIVIRVLRQICAHRGYYLK